MMIMVSQQLVKVKTLPEYTSQPEIIKAGMQLQVAEMNSILRTIK